MSQLDICSFEVEPPLSLPLSYAVSFSFIRSLQGVWSRKKKSPELSFDLQSAYHSFIVIHWQNKCTNRHVMRRRWYPPLTR